MKGIPAVSDEVLTKGLHHMPYRIFIIPILYLILFRWVRWVLALAFVGAVVAKWLV